MPDAQGPGSTKLGWYPDPTDPTRERWWTGSQWTEGYRPIQKEWTAVDFPNFIGGGRTRFHYDAGEAHPYRKLRKP